MTLTTSRTPPLLSRYFDGGFDLLRELSGRYPQAPLMGSFYARTTSATLSTQDGAASIRVEIAEGGVASFTFVLHSMIGLGFTPLPSASDQAHWCASMERKTGEAIFLWDQRRWERDYLIFFPARHTTSIFAFAVRQSEAAARMTPDAAERLTDWLAAAWGV